MLGQMHPCRGVHTSSRASIDDGVMAPGEEGGRLEYHMNLLAYCTNQTPLITVQSYSSRMAN